MDGTSWCILCREGASGGERRRWKAEVEGRKIEMTGETDWRRGGGRIKGCHKGRICAGLLMFLHAAAISQQSPTFYVPRMNLFYPCGFCPPSPTSLPPPSESAIAAPHSTPWVQRAPVARHSCLIGLLNEEWVVLWRVFSGEKLFRNGGKMEEWLHFPPSVNPRMTDSLSLNCDFVLPALFFAPL